MITIIAMQKPTENKAIPYIERMCLSLLLRDALSKELLRSSFDFKFTVNIPKV